MGPAVNPCLYKSSLEKFRPRATMDGVETFMPPASSGTSPVTWVRETQFFLEIHFFYYFLNDCTYLGWANVQLSWDICESVLFGVMSSATRVLCSTSEATGWRYSEKLFSSIAYTSDPEFFGYGWICMCVSSNYLYFIQLYTQAQFSSKAVVVGIDFEHF